MGKSKGSSTGKQKRVCPECNETVWVEWGKSPNLKCPKCGYTDDVEECDRCGNLMSQHGDSVICLDCWKNAMKR